MKKYIIGTLAGALLALAFVSVPGVQISWRRGPASSQEEPPIEWILRFCLMRESKS